MAKKSNESEGTLAEKILEGQKLRMMHAESTLKQHHQLKKNRRDIARIHTQNTLKKKQEGKS